MPYEFDIEGVLRLKAAEICTNQDAREQVADFLQSGRADMPLHIASMISKKENADAIQQQFHSIFGAKYGNIWNSPASVMKLAGELTLDERPFEEVCGYKISEENYRLAAADILGRAYAGAYQEPVDGQLMQPVLGVTEKGRTVPVAPVSNMEQEHGGLRKKVIGVFNLSSAERERAQLQQQAGKVLELLPGHMEKAYEKVQTELRAKAVSSMEKVYCCRSQKEEQDLDHQYFSDENVNSPESRRCGLDLASQRNMMADFVMMGLGHNMESSVNPGSDYLKQDRKEAGKIVLQLALDDREARNTYIRLSANVGNMLDDYRVPDVSMSSYANIMMVGSGLNRYCRMADSTHHMEGFMTLDESVFENDQELMEWKGDFLKFRKMREALRQMGPVFDKIAGSVVSHAKEFTNGEFGLLADGAPQAKAAVLTLGQHESSIRGASLVDLPLLSGKLAENEKKELLAFGKMNFAEKGRYLEQFAHEVMQDFSGRKRETSVVKREAIRFSDLAEPAVSRAERRQDTNVKPERQSARKR